MTIGPVMLDLDGLELTPEELDILAHPQVGGVILFTRNYESPTQLKSLIESIRKARNSYLLIATDQEGGRVQRFRKEFTALPALNTIGQIYDRNQAEGLEIAKLHSWLMATELLSLGVDFSFAPVLDVNKNISSVIGDRSLHRQPDIITVLGKAYLAGMKKAGMASVGKHFPGHGSIAEDSHTAIPVDNRDLPTLFADDLIPFQHCASELHAIMPGHIIFPAVDELPAGFSAKWLQTILRQQLKFEGAIFSDDLSMTGATAVGDITTRTHLALQAGCDIILSCNDRKSACQILDDLERNQVKQTELSNQRLQKMAGRFSLSWQELPKYDLWQNACKTLESACKN